MCVCIFLFFFFFMWQVKKGKYLLYFESYFSNQANQFGILKPRYILTKIKTNCCNKNHASCYRKSSNKIFKSNKIIHEILPSFNDYYLEYGLSAICLLIKLENGKITLQYTECRNDINIFSQKMSIKVTGLESFLVLQKTKK